MPRPRRRAKAEGGKAAKGLPQPAKSEADGNEAGENGERTDSKLPPKAVLDALPEQVRISVVEAASFSGPLPPPSMYREYDRVLPGSADRILEMAEKQQAHRIAMESVALQASAKDSKLGQYFGFCLAVICIGGGIYLATQGQTVAAVALVVASAIGLATQFLKNRRK